ncbi:class I SAM-dependent methyltransferase [Nocardioides guangzhouensis]|uniref:Class I SAM-dependent methyltransferase n=1 Tax=Nocardioides guangzhouensis TaxID=2497878 RepID=A0A4V1XZX4_9ACTN|nr:class I SAM-dependent methyltransferase [Nocardioides guangzhouensis]RYP88259.1 class I SAM-dependent methyltransferase [Nocardioides guangzhouensis]
MDATAWNQRYADKELVWSATPNQFVAAELADLAPGRALDLAAGEGRNALWLASLGWDVTAVDFAQAGLDKGRAVESSLASDHRVTWVCADVLTWEPDGPYDLVVLAYLQLPADERRTAVRRAVGALRRGGTFFLVAHDTSNLTEGTGGPQDASVLMTAEDVLGDLADHDVEVVTAGRFGRAVAGAGETLTAWDAVVRAVRRG